MKKIFVVLLFSAIAFSGGIPAKAAVLNPGPLTVSFSGKSLFNETNLAPGLYSEKKVTVTNNGKTAHPLAISAGNLSGSIVDKIQIAAKINGKKIWSESLAQLASEDNGKIILENIQSGETTSFYLTASMVNEADVAANESATANFQFLTDSDPSTIPGVITTPISGNVSAIITSVSDAFGIPNGSLLKKRLSTSASIGDAATAELSPKAQAAGDPNKILGVDEEESVMTTWFWWYILFAIIAIIGLYYGLVRFLPRRAK